MNLKDLIRRFAHDHKYKVAQKSLYPASVNTNAYGKIVFARKYQFLYNRIRKNANSTLMIAINQLETGTAHAAPVSKTQFTGLADMSHLELNRITTYPFLLVKRNPYSRTLSAFLQKFAKADYQKKYGNFELNPQGFKRFLYWLESGGLNRNSHWDLQTKQMLLRVDQYTDVIAFEQLNEGLAAFFQKVGVPSNVLNLRLWENLGRAHATDSTKQLNLFYDAESLQLMNTLFESDFQALGYRQQLDRVHSATLPQPPEH